MTTGSPTPRLSHAREALRTVEQAEAEERAKLAAILERERQTQYALEQAAGRLRTGQDWQAIESVSDSGESATV